MSGKLSTETIYGTQEESHVMSEKVQSLAATVYKEFERMIKKYDEDVVKDLMPLVVGILESLDAAFSEKQELDVEIELLREDNEQLLTQYEREKQLRKSGDQKYLELEDNVEGVKKELEDKVETLESILRMSEIKAKNSADHVNRLEEKENESKTEYNKLHERYTELFRTHMDYMERTKILMGTDKLSDLTGNSPRVNKSGFSLPGLRPVSVAYGGAMEFQNKFDGTPVGFETSTPHSNHSVSLKNELGSADTPKSDLALSEKEQFIESIDVDETPAGTTSSLSSSTIPVAGSEIPAKSPSDLQTPTSIAQPLDGTPLKPVESVINSSPSQIPHVEKSEPVKELEKSEATVAGEEKPVVLRRKKKKSEDENKFEHMLSYEEDSLSGLDQTLANIVATTPELEEFSESTASQGSISKRKSVRNDNSIFEELSVQGADMIAEVDFGADITGRQVNPGDYASTDSDDNAREEEEEDDKENDKDSVGDNFFGMGKELENLIMENTELLATKNALNIVKDDLIAKVDELSSEQEILREEITSLQAVRGRLQLRITQLEEELKKVREENEKRDKEHTEKGEEEDDVPMAQRKRFTRVEMARVLMERNQYKERLMELQEAVRWTEMIRASREHPGELQTQKKKSTVWNFFSELVAPSPVPAKSNPAPPKEIPARHQNILQAILNTSPDPISSSSFSSSATSSNSSSSASLISSFSNGPQSLANITLLPPPSSKTPIVEQPVPIVVPVSGQMPILPPTPSGAPAPKLDQSFFPSRRDSTATLPGIHARVEPEHEVSVLTQPSSPLYCPFYSSVLYCGSFSNLFSSSNKPKRPTAVATVKYNAPTTQVQPVGDPNKKQRDKGSSNPKSKAYDFLQEDLTSEKAKKERDKERREQYKQVRAHVKKDDGRMQAYGWSLPAKFTTHMARDTPGKSQVPVPVPVYCRPLFDVQNGWKIWCAAGVNLTGGRTRDGGSIVGASVFYSNPPEETLDAVAKTDVDKLDKEIKDHEKSILERETEHMSSLVWVCTSTLEASRVSVIDSNNPADVLESFRVSVSHILCIASIPGATENDYPVAEEILNAEVPTLPKETVVSSGAGLSTGGDSTGLGGVTFVQCATGGSSPVNSSPIGSVNEVKTEDDGGSKLETKAEENVGKANNQEEGEDWDEFIVIESAEEGDPLGATPSEETSHPQVFRAKGSPASSGENTPTHTTRLPDSSSNPELVRDGRSSPAFDSNLQSEETEKLSSVLPTMWMGSQSGSMYVHSSVSNWKRCLHSVKLRDSILGIVHVKGRVLVSLADGTVAIFHRASDGQWDLLNYHLLDLGKPKQSIRCMTVIAGKHVWCGYKNKIHVINPQTMTVDKSFDAHPRKESQVRQLCWLGDGVWVSIRLDSTLRLYHAYTHQHLQDVDIEPYVSKMLGTGKLGFSFVRITAMLISCNRLWIGTGNGVIISVPLSENNKQPMITTSSSLGGPGSSGGRPGGVIRVYSDAKTDSITPGSFIPYCSMAQAQLSFHGHKDAVKFFVSVPARNRKPPMHEGIQRIGLSAASDSAPSSTPLPRGEAIPAPKSNTKLVLSGGEGYVDFRMGDGDEEDPNAVVPVMTNDDDDDDNPAKANSLTKADRSHVIVWQITTQD